MTTLELVSIAGTGLLVGIPVATLVAKIAGFLWKVIVDWLFITKSMADDYSVDSALRYLSANGKSFGFKNDKYTVARHYIYRLKKTKHIFSINTSGSYRIFLYKGIIPILFMPTTYKDKVWEQPGFVFLKGTINWHKVLIDIAAASDAWADDLSLKCKNFCVRHYEGTRRSEFKNAMGSDAPPSSSDSVTASGKYSNLIGWSEEDLETPSEIDPMDQLSVTSSMQKVVNDFEFWNNHQEWYKDRGVPWRWGCLLYGKPGCGKTSLVRAIAKHFDIPVAIFDLSTMDNHDFLLAWKTSKLVPGDARIILLEDFDNVFHGRDNILKRSDLSFETILNAIGGLERENGLALFVTTNDVSKIDEAMGRPTEEGTSTRPGRIDLIAELEGMDYPGLVKIGVRILRDQKLAETLAREFKDDTSAQFEDRAMTKAKELLWKERR